MAATSAPPLSISLPSIHEMFPEHLLKISPNHRLGISETTSNAFLSPHLLTPHHLHRELQLNDSRTDSQIYSFNVLRSDPSSTSLLHIASSATLLNRPSATPGPNRLSDHSNSSAPVFRVNSSSLPGPASGSSSAQPSLASTRTSHPHAPLSLPSDSDPITYSSDEVSDDGDDKKHVCNTCHKRFNRPSSLRIHMNTHTGATPFRCPYPNCGREFNVNSNMRRHYRNHTNPLNNRSQNKEEANMTASVRRRKRRVSVSPPVNTSSGARSSTGLRTDIPMHPPSYETRGSVQRDVSFGFLTQSHTKSESFALNMDEASEESDAESLLEEDELMDEDGCPNPLYSHRGLSPYRLQPVSDFNDRYSSHSLPYRYKQSDIRSHRPPSRPCSTSSNSSPPSSPMSLGSAISGTSPTGFQGTSPSNAFRR
ncbi:MAG: hypothetical protein NXY57DRAFT_733966 [Lentinula lateritia]|uniref:C2H2-type domain-containing protein n=1 Tax=Lentinula lateritia TaxID=40482 RepID=A0ABQ8VF46_9AGAR|nr:MAG: hypothetical protein NXY57DRAFT_733966 [Lentinula lateritia]KAJ4486873.1 hypothetical protein C8R41DRAFT_921251 [Lentinula lateritia]